LTSGVVAAVAGVMIASLLVVGPWQALTEVSVGHGCGGHTLCSVMGFGDATRWTPPTGATYSSNGCAAGDLCYNSTVEESTVTLDSVWLRVLVEPEGQPAAVQPDGGFSIVTLLGEVAAQTSLNGTMSMTAGFDHYEGGYGPASPLTTTMTIVIDLGHGPGPSGTQDYYLEVIGVGSDSGEQTLVPFSLD
jgi:hypothetical protein